MCRVSSLSITMIVSAAGLVVASSARATLPPASAGVQVTTEYGIEFSTIDHPGNAGYPKSTIDWTGEQNERLGRGGVAYNYRIARSEVTSGQWLDFLNTFAPRPMPDNIRSLVGVSGNFIRGPFWWGASSAAFDPVTQTETYALRADVPHAADVPVWGISWRMAAMYCNWLHNGQSSDWNALTTGAYDTHTWSFSANTGYSDDLNHLPDAKFWIPSLDEWGKAAFYDPNRFGQGQGGWWDRPNGSNEIPTPGLPGTLGALSSAGLLGMPVFGDNGLIPLGAYPDSMSPWGLLDTVGGTSELVTEQINPTEPSRFDVLTLGAAAGAFTLNPAYLDGASRAFAGGSNGYLFADQFAGLRIAAAIPAPLSIFAISVISLSTIPRRRSRL